jgi:hypothetical protein
MSFKRPVQDYDQTLVPAIFQLLLIQGNTQLLEPSNVQFT